jgi:hypothetical protein
VTTLRLWALCLSIFLSGLACGSTSSHPAGANDADATPVPHVGAGASAFAARTEPAPARPAAATLAVPASLVDGWLVAIMPSLPPMMPRILEELLGPAAARVLQSPSPLRELGIDVTGTGLLLLAPVDPAQEPLIQRLRAIASASATGQPATADDLAALAGVRQAAGWGELRVRAVIPIVDAETILSTVRALARETRTGRELLSSPNFDVAWNIDDEAAVGMWHDSANLTIDVWMPLDHDSGHEAFPARAAAALTRARSEVIVPDPDATRSSGPAMARLAVDPPAVARIGVLHGDAMVHRAVASVSPEYRTTFLSTGLAEACHSFDLIEGPRGPILRSVRAHARSGLGGLEGELTADLGPGWMQDAALWRPSPSLDFGSVPLGADVDMRWFRGVQFPNGGNSHEAIVRQIQEAGFWGYLVGLPFGSLLAVFEAAEEVADDLPLDRFERAGAFLADASNEREVVFGILPAGTTRAQAACALSPPGQPCGRSRLAFGRTVQVENRFARLVAVDSRLVVLLARQREDLDRAPRHLTAAPVAPARVEVTDVALRTLEPSLSAMAPGRTIFELTSDGATLRTTARTAVVAAARP